MAVSAVAAQSSVKLVRSAPKRPAFVTTKSAVAYLVTVFQAVISAAVAV
jgi:hypothetical protein